MQTVRRLFSLILVFSALAVKAQDQQVILDYIQNYKELAIAEMQRTGVPASIKLAQGIHETMAGTSVLVRKSNNHFGIKCKANWKGESVSHDDDARGECFRKYESSDLSYRDHSDFLKNGQRYAFLFKLDPEDYAGWANGLKKAGYATNPKYPQIIIRLIKDYNLQDYTLIALGKMQEKEIIYANNNEQTEMKPVAAVLRTSGDLENADENLVANFPSGEFKINDVKVIYAKSGTSFLSIAQQYDVSLAKLFDYNDMEEAEVLERDQLIYLQRKRKTGDKEHHVVQQGESLHDIAQAEGVRLSSLLEFNQLDASFRPLAGSTLNLKSNAPSKLLASKQNDNFHHNDAVSYKKISANRAINYEVKKKDTIYSISKLHGVTVDEIMEWNKLRSHNLSVGQYLKIYK
jgi:LysM repeat protein